MAETKMDRRAIRQTYDARQGSIYGDLLDTGVSKEEAERDAHIDAVEFTASQFRMDAEVVDAVVCGEPSDEILRRMHAAEAARDELAKKLLSVEVA